MKCLSQQIKKDILPLLPSLAPGNGITFQLNIHIIRCSVFKPNQADKIKKKMQFIKSKLMCRAYFGQPSNVETVKRASMPLSTLSKLKSLLSHSLLANTVSCREFSTCFQKNPLRTDIENSQSKIAFWCTIIYDVRVMFVLLAVLLSHFGRVCTAVEFTLWEAKD